MCYSLHKGSNRGTLMTYNRKNSCQMMLTVIFSAYQLNWTNHAFFPQNNGNDNYLRHLTNHDKEILTNHGKILTNLMLTVVENYRLTPDGKGALLPSYMYMCM